ncbi:hypothetical protein ILYODFUR_036628 [Ilyodon furcidens]|uniref:Uncharacterized protein n=1 Tax=Ilyodon furcidens TaxID=33524 RepID=A0ABV0UMD8_9TELE
MDPMVTLSTGQLCICAFFPVPVVSLLFSSYSRLAMEISDIPAMNIGAERTVLWIIKILKLRGLEEGFRMLKSVQQVPGAKVIRWHKDLKTELWELVNYLN